MKTNDLLLIGAVGGAGLYLWNQTTDDEDGGMPIWPLAALVVLFMV